MNRLTERMPNGSGVCSSGVKCDSEFDCHDNQCFQEVLNKLAHYEDLEEQGLLIKLPCKVGSTVYLLSSPVNVTNFEEEYNEEDILIFECEVQSISKYKDGRNQVRLYWNNKFIGWYLTLEHFGKTVFLTREEAEKAFKEMEVK